MFQRVIPNQSSSLYTVSSTTLDLPQLAGCNPKFYMEMCESILLAPEVQQAPASFKKKPGLCAEPHISGPEEPDLVIEGAHGTHFSYEMEKLIIPHDIFQFWCSRVH